MQKIKPGDRVIIPPSDFTSPRPPPSACTTAASARVTVELIIEGTDEPRTLTYPADEITAAAVA